MTHLAAVLQLASLVLTWRVGRSPALTGLPPKRQPKLKKAGDQSDV